MTHTPMKHFLFLILLGFSLASSADITLDGIDDSLRSSAVASTSPKLSSAVTEHERTRDPETKRPLTALEKLMTAVGEKPIEEDGKQDRCAKCWSGFTRCFKKTTDYTRWFLDQVETYYPLAREGLEKALVWSEDIALFFGNEELAHKIETWSKKGGRYADIAKRYLEMAQNSSLLLKKVSTTLEALKFESKDDFFSKVRAEIPTLFALARDVKSGAYAYQNEDGDLAFFAKRGDTSAALTLSLDTNIVGLLATDFETHATSLGFKENLKVWTRWKKQFTAAHIGIGGRMKEVFKSLGDKFAKITAVELDQETGTVSFFPPSKMGDEDKEPVFVLTLPGFDKSWNPEAPVEEEVAEDPTAEEGHVIDIDEDAPHEEVAEDPRSGQPTILLEEDEEEEGQDPTVEEVHVINFDEDAPHEEAKEQHEGEDDHPQGEISHTEGEGQPRADVEV